jgi:uncharacterized protein YukE
MAGGQKVSLTALQTHKGEVQSIGDGVKAAAEATAGAGQAMSDNAFGIVGAPFGAAMEIWTAIASSFIGDVASSAEAIADKLQQAHDMYDDHEKQTAGHITGLGKEL